MTQRASESLVAALIRIGLLLALAILLMAENAQAQTPNHQLSKAQPVSAQLLVDAGNTRTPQLT